MITCLFLTWESKDDGLYIAKDPINPLISFVIEKIHGENFRNLFGAFCYYDNNDKTKICESRSIDDLMWQCVARRLSQISNMLYVNGHSISKDHNEKIVNLLQKMRSYLE